MCFYVSFTELSKIIKLNELNQQKFQYNLFFRVIKTLIAILSNGLFGILPSKLLLFHKKTVVNFKDLKE